MTSMKKHSGITEAINRAEFSVIAMTNGWMVYRPEADVGGIDLVIIDLTTDVLRKIQLKSRWTIDKKYTEKSIWIAFPDKNVWYVAPHDDMVSYAQEFGHLSTSSWIDKGGYNMPGMSAALTARMAQWMFYADGQ